MESALADNKANGDCMKETLKEEVLQLAMEESYGQMVTRTKECLRKVNSMEKELTHLLMEQLNKDLGKEVSISHRLNATGSATSTGIKMSLWQTPNLSMKLQERKPAENAHASRRKLSTNKKLFQLCQSSNQLQSTSSFRFSTRSQKYQLACSNFTSKPEFTKLKN